MEWCPLPRSRLHNHVQDSFYQMRYSLSGLFLDFILWNSSSLLDPVVKNLSESQNSSIYRSFQRHQINFYLAVIQFNLESSYRWNPHCSSPSEFIKKSECFDSKFAKMPKEMKCVKLDLKEYKRKCEEDLTGFD